MVKEDRDFTAEIEALLSHAPTGQPLSIVPSDTGDQQEEPITQVVIPEPVVRFIDSMGKNFTGTSQRLRQTANKLMNIAAMLESHADALEKAGPQLTEDVRHWVEYERESDRLDRFYAPIAEKGI